MQPNPTRVSARYLKAGRVSRSALRLLAFIQDGWDVSYFHGREEDHEKISVSSHPLDRGAVAYHTTVAVARQLEGEGLVDKYWDLTPAGRAKDPGARSRQLAEAARPFDYAAAVARAKEARAAQGAALGALKDARRRGESAEVKEALKAAYFAAMEATKVAEMEARRGRRRG
jgi:hypothetical protein